jgi:RimJ/RimL family protein N-acetyltransferase
VTEVLTTARLALRRWTPDDAPAFHAIWGDPRVIWWGPSADVAQSRTILERLRGRCAGDDALGWWALHDRATGACVGSVCTQPAPDPPGGVEIGWHVAHDHQGHGYAREGATALMQHAARTGLRHLVATVIPLNYASCAVARRLGMRPVGLVDRLAVAHVVFARDLASDQLDSVS